MTNSYSDFQLIEINNEHPLKSSIERYVSQRYLRAFKAELNEFMPGYLALYQRNKLISVCGIRSAGESDLFLEQYLSISVDNMIQQYYPEVPRTEIIEFGQLASFSARFSQIHFYLMTKYLVESGFRWCVCTVTDPLFVLMESMGLQPIEIGKADPEKIQDPQRWGQYYQYSPKIVVGNLLQVKQQLENMLGASELKNINLG